MIRTHQALGLLALFAIGLWGCSQSTSGDKSKSLETRITKLEDDLKSAISGREALKSRLVALEEQVRVESERAKLLEKERDDLTAKLQAKVQEKDTAVANYDELVKKLEVVLGQAKVTQTKQADANNGKVQGTVTSMPIVK